MTVLLTLERQAELQQEVEASDLASDQCMREIAFARKRSGIKVVPVLLKTTKWDESGCADLQAIPEQFVDQYPNEDTGLTAVVDEILKLLGELSSPSSASGESAPSDV